MMKTSSKTESSNSDTKSSTEFEKVEVEKNFESILDNFELTICIICGEEVESYWDHRYRGIRASCVQCEINWAES
jgi:hypothetical protein